MTDLTPAETAGRDELPPEQVIAWLRSPKGELWSSSRIDEILERHWEDSGVFADVICDGRLHALKSASWPEPLSIWDLDW